MPKKTYMIQDTHGHYYRSFCDGFFATVHSQVLVTDTTEIKEARKFRSLRWATHRAKFCHSMLSATTMFLKLSKTDQSRCCKSVTKTSSTESETATTKQRER